jgi:ATP-binding cassette subfamily F protein 3
MITLSGITLQRGVQRLLEQSDFAIHTGRRIGLIGPNGCGKSSLFQMLLGNLAIDAGELRVPGSWRIAHMAQEVAASDHSAVQYVMDGDVRLRAVLAEIEDTDDHDRLAHLYADLEAIDGYHARVRAEQLLHGLGFVQEQIERSVTSFSGGWRIRLNLAQALMCPSELLLLDEPTNHLDLDATLWLEQWLKTYAGTLVLISHDRDFLDNIADEIVSIEERKLCSYRGNYSAYERQRAERMAQQAAVHQKQQQRIAQINQYVSRFRAKATKARQAQSRLKELERMTLIAPAHIDSPFDFSFPPPEKTSTPLVNLTDAGLGYGAESVLENVNLSLHPGTRMGLLGPNGAGKSTLVKSLVGDLPLLQGERTAGEHLAIGYFAQHQLEALDLEASALLHIQRLSPTVSEQRIRDFLGGFDFHGDKALEPIAPFSGGEKARLALALVVWCKPNLLLLDEPTNHLDLEMRHALELALQGYAGALVVISHDRHLLRNTVDQYFLVDGGAVAEFDGTLSDYYQRMLKTPGRADKSGEVAATTGQDKKALRRDSAQQRRQLAPLKKKVQQLELSLDRLQQQLVDLTGQLQAPELYDAGNKEQLQQLLRDQGALKKQIDEQEVAWLAAQEALEDGQS